MGTQTQPSLVPPAESLGEAARRLAHGLPRRLGFGRTNLSPRAWQRALRARLLEMLRMPARPTSPPPVETVEQTDCGDYLRQKAWMRAVDGLTVPMYVLVPKRVAPPWPAMLAMAGHGPGKVLPVDLLPEGYDRQKLIVEGQRDYGVQAVRQGFLTVVPELRGFGELMLADVPARSGNTCQQLASRYALAGRSLIGMRTSDLMQVVDWLAARPDVRCDAICATGNSGGGTMTLFLAAADERIRAAVPSCYFCTWADSIMSIDHCPCNYIPDIGQHAECADIAGLVAPRPMLIVAGEQDEIFPIDGVRRAYASLQEIYREFAALDRLELYVGPGGHRYYSQRVWPFLAEHLAR